MTTTSVPGTTDTRESIDAATVSEPWWLRPYGSWLHSTGEIVEALESLAAAIRRAGDVPLPRISFSVDIQVSSPVGTPIEDGAGERIKAVDFLALATGKPEPNLSGRTGHYGSSDSAVSIYSAVQSPAKDEDVLPDGVEIYDASVEDEPAERVCGDCLDAECSCSWGGAFLYACPTCGALPKTWCDRAGEDVDPLSPHEARVELFVDNGEPEDGTR